MGFTITLLLMSTEGREKENHRYGHCPEAISVTGEKEGGREATSPKEVCFHFNRSALLVLSSKSLVDRLRSWMLCICE